jgi:hypothetical protein
MGKKKDRSPPGLERDVPGSPRLSARTVNAIERIWGETVTWRNLLEPDAYTRLMKMRGVGVQAVAEIERALAEADLGSIGGKGVMSEEEQRLVRHRAHLDNSLRELGAKDLLALLQELCRERVKAFDQRLAVTAGRLRTDRYRRARAYYAACCEHLERWVEGAPLRPPKV